jgi:hypothetical protein
MLVFIDESGCAGFKMAKGSDPIFAVGMVIFENGADARVSEACVAGLHARLRHLPEFKFSKCCDAVRDGFFRSVAAQPFTVRALLVRKDTLYSKHLRSNVDAFYNYFVKELMRFDGGRLHGARVRIDGSGDREFRRALGTYLRRELGDRIRDVKTTDSARDQLTQLADMCIGAIARTGRERDDASRWADMLRPRIDDVWHFG